jgi:hypothetical protein
MPAFRPKAVRLLDVARAAGVSRVAAAPVLNNNLQAPRLRLFGFDDTKLNVNFKGLPTRLTNLAGKVVPALFARRFA